MRARLITYEIKPAIEAKQDILDFMNKRVERLQDSLQELVDLQNGPPLIRDAKAWNTAMAEAHRCLGNDEAAERYMKAAEEAIDYYKRGKAAEAGGDDE